MENVTHEFLSGKRVDNSISEEEAQRRSLEAVKSLGLSEDEQQKFLDHLSNGKGSDEEEAKFEALSHARSVTRATYTDSPLVAYTALSPNCNCPRTNRIDTITIHEVWGECSMKALGDIFLPTERQASSNYGVCTDGIALFVHESCRAWTSGSPANDHRAITIETSNSRTYPNAVSDAVYNRLIKLCADICKRNGKKKMIWCGSLAKTNARKFADDEMRMTLHKWFQATDCPGTWLENHMQDIANKVNKLLEEDEKSVFKDVEKNDKYYHVYKALDELNIMNADAKGKFKPNAKVTRKTLAIVAYRILKAVGKIK